jgi:hypothetical protein
LDLEVGAVPLVHLAQQLVGGRGQDPSVSGMLRTRASVR